MMNFQQSDALGGLYEGRKARQAYDTAELQQQQTLEQIANAQQTREFNAAAEPGKREQEGRLRALHPGALEIQQGTIEEARAKQAERLLVDWMRIPDGPNSEQYLMDRYKIQADNPYIHALRQAKAQGPEAVEALRQKVAISDPKSRDDTNRAVQVEKQRGADAAAALERATTVQTLRNSGALAVKTKEGEDRITIAREKAAAVQAKPTKENAEQLGSAAARASVAAQSIIDDPAATPEQKAKAATDKRDADKLILFADQTLERVGAVRAAAAAAPKVDIPGLNRTGMQPVTPRTPIGGGAPAPTQVTPTDVRAAGAAVPAPAPTARPAPTRDKIERLKANPGERALFEAHYGPGSADAILGPKQ